MAAALGGADQVSEERLADGSLRLRRGGVCVLARPNWACAQDPFHASVQPAPRLLDPC